jgi:hypothetical protein
MHAIDLRTDPPGQHIVSVGNDQGRDVEYRCACVLAGLVGIDLEDG